MIEYLEQWPGNVDQDPDVTAQRFKGIYAPDIPFENIAGFKFVNTGTTEFVALYWRSQVLTPDDPQLKKLESLNQLRIQRATVSGKEPTAYDVIQFTLDDFAKHEMVDPRTIPDVSETNHIQK